MRIRSLAVLGAAAMFAISMAGCGGGDDVTLTKAQTQARANAACKQSQQKVTAATASFPKGQIPPTAQVETFAKQTVIPAVQSQIQTLKGLNPPKEDKDTVALVRKKASDALTAIRHDATAILSSSSDPLRPYGDIAAGYGMTECKGFTDQVAHALTGIQN